MTTPKSTPQESILIVDDNPANLRVLNSMLAGQGYQVRPARNGQLAVKTAQANPPDLILLDIQMPDMDGYAVCEQLKASDRTRDVPIIFISALNETGNKVKGFSMGAVDYITKPFQVAEVLARIETHLTLRQLQQNLQEKNATLQEALQFLRSAQQELVQLEKMAALGQLVAGVAHEINTPLGAIRAASNNSKKALEEALRQLPQLDGRLSNERRADFFALVERAKQVDISLTTRQKRQAKRHLIRYLQDNGVERATLVADTLVDIGLYEDVEPFLPLLKESDAEFVLALAYNLVRLQGNHHNILMAVERAAKIVFALKSYAHYDQTGERVLTQVETGLETVLMLYHNYLKKGVEVIRDFNEVPAILGYPDELNQVWTNLIHNSLQAMQHQGKLDIRVTTESVQASEQPQVSPGRYVVVSITDDGPGIPEAVQARLFEPFYTTKAPGEGSGLGLSISKNIVDKHQGYLTMASRPGRTTFRVWLPVEPSGSLSK